jgi:hypothetical protein
MSTDDSTPEAKAKAPAKPKPKPKKPKKPRKPAQMPVPTPEEQVEIDAVAATIADHINESKPHPRAAIRKLVTLLGIARAQELLMETDAVAQAGGMRTKDGARPRTHGGIFFRLARDSMPVRLRMLVWPMTQPKQPTPKKPMTTPATTTPPPTITPPTSNATQLELGRKKNV